MTEQCGNIHAQILHLYGEDCLKETRVFEKLRLKLKKRMVDLTFLKRYRDSSILPFFTQIKHHLGRHDHQRILVKAKQDILGVEIQSTRLDLS